MCNLVEEKYQVAKIILVVSKFSTADILDNLKSNYTPDAVYTVIGELLEKGLIEVSRRPYLSLANQNVKIYEVIVNKHDELEQYVQDLDQMRVEPDNQGKPRSLNYRVAEQIMGQVTIHPEILQRKDREVLLTAIYQYLALAQGDEITRQPRDSHREVISEAYLRMLYGQYLGLREQWANGIMHLLIASRLFEENKLTDMQRAVESRAVEMLINRYVKSKSGSFTLIKNMVEFAKLTDEILKAAMSEKCLSPVFSFISHYILNEVMDKIDNLDRKDGDFTTAAYEKWTVSTSFDNQVIKALYGLLNKARLSIMSRERTKAQQILEEALEILESNREVINPEEATIIEVILKRHLTSLKAYDALDKSYKDLQLKDLNRAAFHISILNQLEFGGLLPFYFAEVMEKVKVVLNRLSEELTIQTMTTKTITISDMPSLKISTALGPKDELPIEEWKQWEGSSGGRIFKNTGLFGQRGPVDLPITILSDQIQPNLGSENIGSQTEAVANTNQQIPYSISRFTEAVANTNQQIPYSISRFTEVAANINQEATSQLQGFQTIENKKNSYFAMVGPQPKSEDRLQSLT
jgi:hypothetical protein